MQEHLKKNLGRYSQSLVVSLLGLSLAAALSATKPETVVNAKPPISHLSEFIDDPKTGKDPFFPNSTRRQVTESNTNVVIEPVAVIANWRLQGLSGTKENRLAIISTGSAFYRTLSAGEEVEVKINGKPVNVQCVEIRDHSVMLKINGQIQELKMSQRF